MTQKKENYATEVTEYWLMKTKEYNENVTEVTIRNL